MTADTFTLSPLAMSVAQRQPYGVSPGHSGVPSRRAMLMSLITPECRTSPGRSTSEA